MHILLYVKKLSVNCRLHLKYVSVVVKVVLPMDVPLSNTSIVTSQSWSSHGYWIRNYPFLDHNIYIYIGILKHILDVSPDTERKYLTKFISWLIHCKVLFHNFHSSIVMSLNPKICEFRLM